MKDNKTLLILTPGFPANENDSSSLTFPQIFVRNLKQLNPGLNIIVLAFQYPFTAGNYEWHGAKVYSFNGKNKGRLNRLLVWRAVWNKIRLIVKEYQVAGILNLWLGECALIGKYASKKYGLKNFTWLLGQDARRNNRYFRLIKPAAGTLIALSDFISDEFYRNYYIRPGHTIPAGIDEKMFHSGSLNREIDIMGAGSLIPLKQYALFINMVGELVKTQPGLNAIICGEGTERDKLQQMINKNNLSKNINLMGEVPHQQILSLMQSAKIFLHTSSYEGFSTVCAEALYAGAHVISFCKPMNKEIDHLYIAGTEKEMLGLLHKMVFNEELSHYPVLTYPIEEVCKKVLSLYE